MNNFIDAMTEVSNIGYTENGAVKRNHTNSALLDMFAMGAAMRTRSEADVILMFRKAFAESPSYALKCLFYIRDVRGGQGERRFFRVVMRDLAKTETEVARRNMKLIPIYGRWDDLYTFVGTPLEAEAFDIMKQQFILDLSCKTPSLLAKWLKSENTSSKESRELGNKTRKAFGLNHKQYRKALSTLRERINVLERLMSAGKWDEIKFDELPSRAGFIYRNAFARHDIAKRYEEFAKSSDTKVNAKALYPYECVSRAFGEALKPLDDVNRLMVNKYWDNLADYFKEASFNGMAVVDVSGSMCGYSDSAPINVAISLGLYCAEKAKGPYANHFITFSSNPKFVKVEGVDFCDKVDRMADADWGGSTNIEAAFDLMLNVAVNNNLKQEDIPENLIIISDMEFDACAESGPIVEHRWGHFQKANKETLFETMKKRWESHGYKMPKLVFWNVEARQNNIAMRDDGNVNYVSGMNPVLFEQIMKGLNAWDLMMDKLNSYRYKDIY